MIRPVRLAVAAALRWVAHGLLLDTRVSNLIARCLLVASKWVRGVDAPEIPAAPAGEGEV